MLKSELINDLQDIEGDFEIIIKVPSEFALIADHISINEEKETITIYSK